MCHSAFCLTDDVGHKWDMRVDAPAAVIAAVSRAVDRWKLRRALDAEPAAKPISSDVHVGTQSQLADTVLHAPGGMRLVLVDLSS